MPERIRDERAHDLLDLSAPLHRIYTERWVGRQVEVVLEKDRTAAGDGWRGLSENYLKVLVRGVPAETGRAGNVVQAVIEQAGDPCLGRFAE